jgi:voltage-gated potassium channel Kch
MPLDFVLGSLGTRHYSALLAVAVITLAATALPPPYEHLANLGFSMLIILQIRLLARQGSSATTSMIFRLLGWLSLASLWLWLLTPAGMRSSGLPLLIVLTLFEVQAYPRLVKRLSREKRVTADVLTGALAGYVLLGLMATLITALLESINPGSFDGMLRSGCEATGIDTCGASLREMRFIHVAYFAFVTLTTLGYGDIVPLTPLAKLSTIVFSLLGPFYLAVNMGVLIGRYIQQEQQES